MARPISDLFRGVTEDHRWAGPTHMCVCGCDMLITMCKFQDGEIVFYMLDGMCANCGALLRLPTPIDGDDGN